jgi:hypothetical protein
VGVSFRNTSSDNWLLVVTLFLEIMKNLNVARLACGLGLVVLGNAPSAFAQPAQNYVFGTLEGYACIAKQVHIKLKDGETSEFFETTQKCTSTDAINRKEINRLFGGQGRNTYVRNDRDQITRKAVW